MSLARLPEHRKSSSSLSKPSTAAQPRVFRLPEHGGPPRFDILEHENIIDRQIYAVLTAMRAEAEKIEDKDTRERWLDALQTFARTGDIRVLLEETEWRRKVVPMEQFIYDPLYLNIERGSLYPKVEEALIEIDEDDFNEVILMGALGIGKSTIAHIGTCRDIYRLSCMRNPQTSFGIQGKAHISFTIQSVRASTAKIAIFQELGALINGSPYFRHVFPYNPKISSRMVFPEHHIQIMPVTTSTTAVISLNVLGGIMDEANFMQKIAKSKAQFADEEGIFDQAKELYKVHTGRRKTRFNRRGQMPGKFYLASSARYPTDFTKERALKSAMYGGTDPKIYVYNYSQWEGKPRSGFLKEEFRVQVGNENHRSRVLADNEPEAFGTQVIRVPMDFYQEFVDDPDKSIRDYAGLPLLSVNPFISRREAIGRAFELAEKYGYKSPYNVTMTDLTGGIPIPDISRIRKDVPSYRVAHIDLGLTKDAAGIAIGHLAGYKIGKMRADGMDADKNDDEGTLSVLPIIAMDAVMRIVHPVNGEIDFSEVRRFLKVFRDTSGLDVRYVTTDGFQSVDTRQILRKEGFMTDYLSVEKAESSRSMRTALYDGRLLIPQHEWLAKEMRELETRTHNNKEIIDHPNKGTKDVIDAVTGVVQFLLSRRSTWAHIRVDKGPGYHFFGDSESIAQEAAATPALPQTVQRAEGRPRVDIQRRDTTRHPVNRK